jgi:hypothetical protein
VQPRFLSNAPFGSSTLRLQVPAYTGRFEVFVFAEEPDLVIVEIETIPIVARRTASRFISLA